MSGDNDMTPGTTTGPAIRRMVIAGGGLTAWMTAAALSKAVNLDEYSITVVGNRDVGDNTALFGSADATLPSNDNLHAALDLDEKRVIANTSSSFTLGIALGGWSATAATYFHPFSSIGASLGPLPFHQIIMKLRREGVNARLGNYALAAMAAQAGRFDRPAHDTRSVLSTCRYGLHLDTASLPDLLQHEAEAAGVIHVAGPLGDVVRSDDGSIRSLNTASGTQISGDLFIDCTGDDAHLIGRANNNDWQDWSEWLPCNRVLSASAESVDAPLPYSYAQTNEGGWTRHLPLQDKTAFSVFYSDSVMSNDNALEALQTSAGSGELAAIQSDAVAFGQRTQPWQHNCIALGTAAVVIDPVAMSNLQLLRSAINRLLRLLPTSQDMTIVATEYNRQTTMQHDNARDFAMLHYKLNGRQGESLWDSCRNMSIPDSLQYRLRLYESRGRVVQYDEEMIEDLSWINLFDAHGVHPQHKHPLMGGVDTARLQDHVDRIRAVMIEELGKMPTHAEYLSRLGGNIR